MISGMFCILHTGAPWRDLPVRCGPYTIVHKRSDRWARRGSDCGCSCPRPSNPRLASSPRLLDRARPSARRGREKGSGPRHRTISRQTKDQDPPRRRRPRPAAGRRCSRRSRLLRPGHHRSPRGSRHHRSVPRPAQPRRGLLQQTRTLPRHRHTLARARPKLPRRHVSFRLRVRHRESTVWWCAAPRPCGGPTRTVELRRRGYGRSRGDPASRRRRPPGHSNGRTLGSDVIPEKDRPARFVALCQRLSRDPEQSACPALPTLHGAADVSRCATGDDGSREPVRSAVRRDFARRLTPALLLHRMIVPGTEDEPRGFDLRPSSSLTL